MDRLAATNGSDAQHPPISNDAFISYSRKDEQFAAALQKALQAYKPPKNLNLPQRYLTVFRDKEDFTGVEYHQSLEKHLKNSGKLILICSPNAGKSSYVEDEIEHFVSLHGAENIIPVLLAGTPDNEAIPGREDDLCFPRALVHVLKMPLAVNYKGFHPEKHKVDKGIYYGSWYTLLANIYGISRTEIEQRDKKRRMHRYFVLGAITFGVFGVLVYSWQRERTARLNEIDATNEANRQRDVAREQKKTADEATKKALERERVAQAQKLAAQSSRLLDDMPQRSLLLAIEAARLARQVDGKRVAQAEEALRYAIEHTGGRTIWRTTRPITCVAMSRSGNSRWLAAASESGTVMLWDLSRRTQAGRPLEIRGNKKRVNCLAISPDDRWLVTGGDDKTVRRWDLSDRKPEKTMAILSRHRNPVAALAIDPYSRRLAFSVLNERTVYISDFSNKQPNETPLRHPEPVETLTISPDGKLLGTGDKKGTVSIWNFADPRLGSRSFPVHGGAVKAIAISPDNRFVLSGGEDKTTRLWELTGGSDLTGPGSYGLERSHRDLAPRRLLGHAEYVFAVSITPDGRYALSADGAGSIFRWDLSNGARTKETLLFGHKSAVYSLAVSSDSTCLLSAGEDHTSRVWNLDFPQPSQQSTILRGHDGRLSAVAISADKTWAVTGSRDGTVRLWKLSADAPNPKPGGYRSSLASFPMRQTATPEKLQGNIRLLGNLSPGEDIGEVYSVAISPDNNWIAIGEELSSGPKDSGGVTWLWKRSSSDLFSRAQARPLPNAKARKPVRSSVFSPDGRWLASGDDAGELKIWRLDKGTITEPLHGGNDSPILALAISPDSHWLVSGCRNGSIRIWDLRTAPKSLSFRQLSDRGNPITALAITPDSHQLVTGSNDGSLRLWRLGPDAANKKFVRLSGHGRAVTAMAISRDGRWLATASEDKTARVWDLKFAGPNHPPKVLVGHQRALKAIAIGSDGHWLVTGSEDNTARLWDLTSDHPNATVKILRGHDKTVSSVAITADNNWVVTASYDTTVRLWDPTAPDPSADPTVLRGHKDGINAMALSNNGRFLVTGGSYDYCAHLWILQTRDLMDLARMLAGRDLTDEERGQYLGRQTWKGQRNAFKK